VFRMPTAAFGYTTCAVPLGIAREAIDGLRALAGRSDLKNQGYAQYALAKAQALQESGHLYIRDSYRPIWAFANGGPPLTMEQRARARRSYVHAVESAVAAVTLCNEAAGGSAVFESQPFARALRDVHAAQGHAVLSRRFMEMAGAAELGLPIAHPIF
jgi:alkylation response protein AidB-like acyl-CoA dehydrogenase